MDKDAYATAHAALLAELADIVASIEDMPCPESADYGDLAQLGRLAAFVRDLAIVAGVRDE